MTRHLTLRAWSLLCGDRDFGQLPCDKAACDGSTIKGNEHYNVRATELPVSSPPPTCPRCLSLFNKAKERLGAVARAD
jgi:hypothetical protein